MNEERVELLKKVKLWNLILAIVATVMSVLMVVGAFSLISTKIMLQSSQLVEAFDAKTMASLEASVTQMAIGVSIVSTLLVLVLTVVFYIFNAKLKKQKPVTKIPYFLYLLPFLYTIILGLVNGNLGNPFAIIGQIINILSCVPAVLIILYLFKLDSDN